MGLIVPRVRVSPSFKIFALTLLLLTAGGGGVTYGSGGFSLGGDIRWISTGVAS